MFQPLLFFFTSYIILFPEQSYNLVNIDKVLDLLQYHLEKVAKYQYTLEILTNMSKPLTVDFIYFYFFSFVLFFLFFSFLFPIFRTAQVRGYQSCCHISHNLMA